MNFQERQYKKKMENFRKFQRSHGKNRLEFQGVGSSKNIKILNMKGEGEVQFFWQTPLLRLVIFGIFGMVLRSFEFQTQPVSVEIQILLLSLMSYNFTVKSTA